MTKFILFIIILFSSLFVSAQENISVTICNQEIKEKVTKKTTYHFIVLSQEELIRCSTLETSKKEWKVNSFSIGFAANDNYYEQRTKGNSLTEKMVDMIKKYQPKKIYVEQITLLSKTNEGMRIQPLVVELK